MRSLNRTACLLLASVWGLMPLGLSAQPAVHKALIAPQNRKLAPAFSLLNVNGARINISDYRGKVIALNFWATECGGCVLEIPSFISLEHIYKNKSFTTIGVSMDISYEHLKNFKEAWGRVKHFVATNHLNYPIVMGDGAISKTYDLKMLPVTYLIDKSGKIAIAYVAEVIDQKEVAGNIERLLSER